MPRTLTAAPKALRLAAALTGLGLVASACTWRSPVVSLEIPVVAQTSRVYAADGTLITSLHAEEDRELVPLKRMPKAFRQAVVAIEDERFWEHKGVDFQAVVRAARENATSGKLVEGGSTITQQYVKNAYVGNNRNLSRKLKEASLAYQLERRYTKERILELYLNSVYFGNGAYGAEAASHEYFGLPVDRLDLAQSALLAGIIRSPNRSDPFDHPEVALARRAVVIDKMLELSLITQEQADAVRAAPLGVVARAADERYAAPHFIERVKRFILDDPRFGATPKARRDLLFRGGLKINTTLDLRKQALAEQAVARVLSKPARDPAAAVVSINPQNGHVEALVGGRDFFGGGADAKFDLATQGRRQAGSAFKPFVLAAALKKGFTLDRTYSAPSGLTIPLGKNSVWVVDNYEGATYGRLDMVEATVRSSNTFYAQLIMDVGPAEAVALAAEMGIRSPLQPFPSAVLGTNDVTVLDMASAYGTLANRGLATTPTFMTTIVGRDGRVIYAARRGQKRVLSSAITAAEVGVLRQVVERGTGVKANIGRPVAGKTGTGQQWRDAWFVGFTPDLVTAVWVGFPQGQRSMVPPATRTRVTGGSWPAEIWQLYSSATMAQLPITDFPEAPPLEPPPPPPDIVIPDVGPRQIVDNVIGMPADEAQATLERSGLRVRQRVVSNGEYPPGIVVATNPPAGAKVKANSLVTINVATPAVYSTVPSLLGRTRAEAQALLREAGLQMRVTTGWEPEAEGREPTPGMVWQQNPATGTTVEEGTIVKVWINPT